MISAVFIGGILFAQSEAKITVKEIQKEFKYKKYSAEILKKFVNQISEIEQKPYVTEFVPGEIIGWNNDRSSYSTQEIFKITGNKLVEISTIPQNENFFAKLNKFASNNQIFSFENNGRNYEAKSIKKSKNGDYILNSEIYILEKNSNSDILETYEIEYKTKDFKNFTPLKIRNVEKKSTSKTIKQTYYS